MTQEPFCRMGGDVPQADAVTGPELRFGRRMLSGVMVRSMA